MNVMWKGSKARVPATVTAVTTASGEALLRVKIQGTDGYFEKAASDVAEFIDTEKRTVASESDTKALLESVGVEFED